MRFHLDEHIDHAIAAGLRLRGIDVTTTTEANLVSAADPEHLAFAISENRVVVTNDTDFLRYHNQGIAHLGIVFVSRDQMRIGEVVHGLLLINACLSESEMRGHVEFL